LFHYWISGSIAVSIKEAHQRSPGRPPVAVGKELCPNRGPVSKPFYEKVVKVKADLAAILKFFPADHLQLSLVSIHIQRVQVGLPLLSISRPFEGQYLNLDGTILSESTRPRQNSKKESSPRSSPV
jgi:hypothetical protein